MADQELQKRDDNLELLPEEDRAALMEARQENAPQIQFGKKYDTIKLKDSEQKVEGLVRGQYFVESYDPNAPKEQRKNFRNIGTNPHIIILCEYSTYSYNNGESLVSWTTDIRPFADESDYVALFSQRTGKLEVERVLNVPDMRKYMERVYVARSETDEEKKLMRYQTILYVLFEGKVHRMFVSNASKAGVAPGAKGGDFSNPQPNSLIHFINTTKQQNGGALLEHVCQLGAWFKDDVTQPYWIRTFENVGMNKDDLVTAVRERKAIVFDHMQEQKMLVERKSIKELGEERGGFIEVEPINKHPNEIKAEDLPF